ncbi:MAG TPA: large conductance mechanosensitive channel protein MscL [Candidatus Binataceae bacterium]|nr:large conductance mechanosensitive channel protein MscL [Candidatus Binataceae bacterium]
MFETQLKKFREFAIKGNVVDMAIGIVIGASFGKIATSLVNDLIMPPIGLLLGRVDFNSLFIPLDGKTYASLDAAKKAGAATFNYGSFINTVLDFVIVAFAMFLIVQWYQTMADRLEKPAPAAAPTTKDCPFCMSPIPVGATRCPHCTSQLGQSQAA